MQRKRVTVNEGNMPEEEKGQTTGTTKKKGERRWPRSLKNCKGTAMKIILPKEYETEGGE